MVLDGKTGQDMLKEVTTYYRMFIYITQGKGQALDTTRDFEIRLLDFKMPRFDVNFADPKRFFYPGETVAGTITVRMDEPMIVRRITLAFEGKSRVSWTTGHGKDMKFHSNSEEYFKHKDTLLGPGSPPEEGIPLNVGDYTYPFQYELPGCLPPSFETLTNSGYVWYSMYVTVEDVDKSGPHHPDSQIFFKVVATPVDLNETRHLLETRTESVEKFLCCLCCKSGPLLLRAELQKQAFRVEEPIIFSFELDNKATNKALRKVEARLVQRVMFYSPSRTEENEFTISSEVLSEEIPPGGEGTWQDVRLNLPPDTVPSFECKCILVEYYFIVSVDIESAFDPKVLIPITIVNGVRTVQPESSGLVRTENGISIVDGIVNYQPPAGPPPSGPLSPVAGSPPEEPPPPYSGLPPPSKPPPPASMPRPAITQQPHPSGTV